MKFKVGDLVMVIQNSAPILYQGYYEIPHRITEISNCIIVDDDTPLGFSECNLKLWQPKVDEYCWFGFTNQWHPNNDYILGKLINIIEDNGCITYNCEPIHSEIDGNDFDYCEPFIGTLPSFIKETK